MPTLHPKCIVYLLREEPDADDIARKIREHIKKTGPIYDAKSGFVQDAWPGRDAHFLVLCDSGITEEAAQKLADKEMKDILGE